MFTYGEAKIGDILCKQKWYPKIVQDGNISGDGNSWKLVEIVTDQAGTEMEEKMKNSRYTVGEARDGVIPPANRNDGTWFKKSYNMET